jgi:phage tail sheath protein FI
MAEKVYKSAGVFATETDLSSPTQQGPSGIPAGVVGTSNAGPAFVPITVGSYSDFISVFGATDGEKFGPLAVYTFLENAQALTFLRVLGVGDGKKRSDSTGKVANAGYLVGGDQVQANGIVSSNTYAVNNSAHPYGEAGRTYFLGCFMSASAGSMIFEDAGLDSVQPSKTDAIPIIRGVLMAASGVVLQLSGNSTANTGQPSNSNTAYASSTNLQGALTGSVNLSNGEFVMLLNGHKNTSDSPNVITASFDSSHYSYFATHPQINTDPLKIEEKGHMLYSWYDINPAFAVITGSGITSPWLAKESGGNGDFYDDIGFILTGSAARDTYTAAVTPNYESFQDRFSHPRTPFFISQDFGGTKYDLFRVHCRGDGDDLNSKYKISIRNIKPASDTASNQHGSFDLIVREFDDRDSDLKIVENWIGLSLDPSSEKYIARIIGDQYVYFDFDQAAGSQKLVVKGDHAGSSPLIRVEMAALVDNGTIPDKSLPVGYRGPDHLVTSGSGPLISYSGLNSDTAGNLQTDSAVWQRAVELPIRYRKDIKKPVAGTSTDIKASTSLFWGVQFSKRVKDVLVPNVLDVNELRSLNSANAAFDESMRSRTKFFPQFSVGTDFQFSVGNNPGVADVNGTILDCDKFNNNIFTLERIRVVTGSDGYAKTDMWNSASYIRQGSIATNHAKKTRAFEVSDLSVQGNRTYAKFTTLMQGGFNGTNIFNKDQYELDSASASREMSDSTNQGGVDGSTVGSFRKAIDIMGVKADVDIKLLAIPGMRSSAVSDYAIDAIESRFDSMYIMDIDQRDEYNTVMTASKDSDGNMIVPNVSNTATAFAGRGLDTSFAAAYFPDLIMNDPTTGGSLQVPPSVGVLGAFALNDARAFPWFAPAGFSRGSLSSKITSAALTLNRDNLDDLYEEKINPITAFEGGKPVVWGQKTLLADASALDRVNVRRLLIDIRRKVKNVANSMLFEPNRQETLDRFNALVKPIMQNVQQRSGVDRYKVIIDTTTTTQADIENNTIRGKIFLQPTRTAEFVALDFTVTNAGNFDSV